ncbi:evasin P1074-like [Ixodes scapularis]
MAFNVITFLQLAVFAVILLNINLHSASAESKEMSDPQRSLSSIEAEHCKINCTKGKDGKWSECSEGCICVPVKNRKDTREGRCIMFFTGDYFGTPDPQD